MFFGASPPRDAPSPQPNEDPFINGLITTQQNQRMFFNFIINV